MSSEKEKDRRRDIAHILTDSGKGLLLLSFLLAVVSLQLESKAESHSDQALAQIQHSLLPQSLQHSDNGIVFPASGADLNEYAGILEIEKGQLTLPVAQKMKKLSLEKGACVYQGSFKIPGFSILSLNTPSYFGTLQQLKPGQSVSFTNMNGETLMYRVAFTEVLSRAQLKKAAYLLWDLNLITPTLDGNRWIVLHAARSS